MGSSGGDCSYTHLCILDHYNPIIKPLNEEYDGGLSFDKYNILEVLLAWLFIDEKVEI